MALHDLCDGYWAAPVSGALSYTIHIISLLPAQLPGNWGSKALANLVKTHSSEVFLIWPFWSQTYSLSVICFGFVHYFLSDSTWVAWLQMPKYSGNSHEMKNSTWHVFNISNSFKITINNVSPIFHSSLFYPSTWFSSDCTISQVPHVSESSSSFLGTKFSPHYISLLSNRR